MYSIIVDNNYQKKATEIIKSAEKEILLSTFKIQYCEKLRGRKLANLIKEITNKAKQGVKVFFLMNWEEKRKGVARTNEPVANLLTASGARVKYLKNRRCCHAKILIADNNKALIGSHNWSISSQEKNFELSIYTEEHKLIKETKEIYFRSFNEAENWLHF